MIKHSKINIENSEICNKTSNLLSNKIAKNMIFLLYKINKIAKNMIFLLYKIKKIKLCQTSDITCKNVKH